MWLLLNFTRQFLMMAMSSNVMKVKHVVLSMEDKLAVQKW